MTREGYLEIYEEDRPLLKEVLKDLNSKECTSVGIPIKRVYNGFSHKWEIKGVFGKIENG